MSGLVAFEGRGRPVVVVVGVVLLLVAVARRREDRVDVKAASLVEGLVFSECLEVRGRGRP